MSRNGDTPFDPRASGTLGDLSHDTERALLERAVRAAHAASIEAGVATEYVRELRAGMAAIQECLDALTVSVARMRAEQSRQSAKLGLVDSEIKRVERRASRPDLAAHTVDFAALAYEREDTEVRRIKAELAYTEQKRLAELEKDKQLRAEAAMLRADVWKWVRPVGALVVAAGGAVLIAAMKGCL